ncbi:D-alanine--D-alanine ligase [Nonomuraea typhae]|uniref:D-alanine--D-alanine ligase n=1 Tax=Nonomuraea typhae TaxID=2603600 RepID=A0ABW7YX60_9ACTN
MRVGVLTGGRSRERARSLLSGRAAHASLVRQGFDAVLIDTAGAAFLHRLGTVDVAFLAIAGQYAEDGKLQGLLEHLNVPYTGSGVLASALAMHKCAAKAMVGAHGVGTLPGRRLDDGRPAEQLAAELTSALGLPLMLKPVSEGGSIDIHLCTAEPELLGAIRALRSSGQQVFAERFCPGRSVTAAVLDHEPGLWVPPLLETRPVSGFYDYQTKNDPGRFTHHCPAALPEKAEELIAEWARVAHRALGCRGYSRSDFVVGADGEAWWLETNTLPGLSRTGNLATMAGAGGLDYDGLVSFVLSTALRAPAGYRA